MGDAGTESRPETQKLLRLFVEAELREGAVVGLTREHAHYLQRVMRRAVGDQILLFNGRDGEWAANIEGLGRGWCSAALTRQTRPQSKEPDLWLVFAPIKRARVDFLAEKATELGVSALWPVFTKHTAVSRVNSERLRANATEAAEQSERLSVPEVFPAATLAEVIARWPKDRRIILCDETGRGVPVGEAVSTVEPGAPHAIVTGPEGGFDSRELDAICELPSVTRVSLGPRVLRADTAALAALACFQAGAGDWRLKRTLPTP